MLMEGARTLWPAIPCRRRRSSPATPPTSRSSSSARGRNCSSDTGSGVDILVNPYESTAYMRGRVLMRVMRDVDVAVRHGESFAYATLTVWTCRAPADLWAETSHPDRCVAAQPGG